MCMCLFVCIYIYIYIYIWNASRAKGFQGWDVKPARRAPRAAEKRGAPLAGLSVKRMSMIFRFGRLFDLRRVGDGRRARPSLGSPAGPEVRALCSHLPLGAMSVTYAYIDCPVTSSGMPTTAASETSAQPTRADSTSAVPGAAVRSAGS